MSQQNTALIDDIMAALDAESSQNVELIVRNTQNGATKKMALASLEQIIYSYLTTAPVVSNLASVLGGVKNKGVIRSGDLDSYYVADSNYRYSLNASGGPGSISHSPISWGDYISIGRTELCLGQYNPADPVRLFVRNYGPTESWVEMSSAAFLNSYTSLSSLASAMGVMTASVYQLSDERTWDAITQTTFVLASGNNGGVPSPMKYGVGVAIVRGTVGIQIYKPNSSDTNIYFRQRWNGAWASQWYKVGATVVADL